VKPAREVFVVGGAHTPFIGKHHPDFIWKGHPEFGRRENPTLEEHLAAAVRETFSTTGVDASLIDRAFVGNFAGECFANQGHLGAMLAGVLRDIDPAIEGLPAARVEAACASGGVAIVYAIEAIAAGADIVLVAGAEVQTTVSAREGADYLARAGYYEAQRPIDPFTFPCLFARRAQAYRAAYGIDDETLAAPVLKAHRNAAKNPLAHLSAVGASMDLERASRSSDANPNFLENEDYRDHLRLSDCSPVSDGASALILASREGITKIGTSTDSVPAIDGYALIAAPLQNVDTDPLRLENIAAAAKIAYASSGTSAASIDVAEVHDCFSIAEVEIMEALGFAAEGEGAAYIASGATAVDGERPVNTGGGLIGFGHPVGATGVKQVLEVARQLRGDCGEYQVARDVRVGLSANMGGDDRTAVVVVQSLD